LHYYGEIAALTTALCWAFNSVVFSNAGHRVGSLTVNRVRLYIAFISLLIFHFIYFGSFYPISYGSGNYIYLGLSGIIGYIIGDSFLFESFLMIGPRLSMLIMTSAPIFSAILAWLFLKEHLDFLQIIAMLITLFGIGWVISEKGNHQDSKQKPKLLLGVLFATIGSIGQAVSLLFSKMGLTGGISTISANLIRVSAATVFIFLFSIITKKFIKDIKKMRDKKAFIEIGSGSLIGPVLGVILSLEAINHTHIGIASTLMALSPVILIPVSHYLYKERITWRAVIGTIIAIGGAAWLFFL
jgi:drug/metabolite transporter (DMT)-like permease